MTIVYCLPGLYNPAGMERVITQKANWLARHGHKVVIITSDQMGRRPFFVLHQGIDTCDLGINYEATNGKNLIVKAVGYLLKSQKHKKRLQKQLEQLRPDVVVSTGGVDAPAVAASHGPWRKIQEAHFSRFKYLEYQRKGLWGMADRWRNKQSVALAARFERMVVLTHEDAQYWAPLDNVAVIPNPRTFASDKTSDLKAKTVLSVGRLTFQKGFDRLIKAWALLSPIHPEWTLSIVGQGEEETALKQLAAQLGVGRTVEFRTDRPNMEAMYLGAAMLAVPSRYEGLPMVMLEAQEYGLPMVAFDCKCGPKDLIDQGENGILVRNGDIIALANALETLMLDEVLRRRMGQAARQSSAEYAEDRIMQRWQALFHQLTSDPTPR